jgi:hypothetical protein
VPKEGKRKASSSFLKKRTKKLLSYVEPIGLGVRRLPPRRRLLYVIKVFCFFFSKKKYFLA